MKFTIAELCASQIIRPDMIVVGYDPRRPVLPLEWPRIAGDVAIQMAEMVVRARTAAEPAQPSEEAEG